MKTILLICLIMFAANPVFADDPVTGWPEYWVEATTADPGQMSLFCVPDGSGRPFAAAFNGTGGTVDATIELRLYENLPPDNIPIANFPGEDMWLQGSQGNLAACNGTARADQATDDLGRTWWRLPLRAGGRIDRGAGEVLQILINGDVVGGGFIQGFAPENLSVNSADLSGEGLVNLTDAGMFAGDLTGPYDYRSDFAWDGVVNLSDAGLMAAALGRNCP